MQKRFTGKMARHFADHGFINFCGNRVKYEGPFIPEGATVTFVREVVGGKLVATDVRVESGHQRGSRP
jgi:hypothetical protein